MRTRAELIEPNAKILELVKSELSGFPNLHAFIRDGKLVVAGSLALSHDGAEFDRYLLELRLDEKHPHVPPVVYEVGGRIPRHIDRHTYQSGALCLGVPEELWPKPGTAINLADFLNQHVRSYLVANTLVEEGQPWPFGERSHGHKGTLEFYAEKYGIDNPTAVMSLLSYAIKTASKGHWNCFCGSGKRMRDCHPDTVHRLRENINQNILKFSFVNIYDATLGKKEPASVAS